MILMAMTNAQRAAFETASGGTVKGYEYLWIGAFFVFLFLWAAWSLLVLYKGFANGNVSVAELGGGFIRLLLLILIGAAFLLAN